MHQVLSMQMLHIGAICIPWTFNVLYSRQKTVLILLLLDNKRDSHRYFEILNFVFERSCKNSSSQFSQGCKLSFLLLNEFGHDLNGWWLKADKSRWANRLFWRNVNMNAFNMCYNGSVGQLVYIRRGNTKILNEQA